MPRSNPRRTWLLFPLSALLLLCAPASRAERSEPSSSSAASLDAMRERLDLDRDGRIDAGERRAARQVLREARGPGTSRGERADAAAWRESRRARVMRRFDADRNGVLDGPELDALLDAHGGRFGRFAERRQPAGPLAGFDANRDGVLDARERETARRAFLDRFDRNGDGRIDGEERDALRERFGGGAAPER